MTVRRFLFAMWDGGGTVAPEMAVAARLRARGHEVDVLGDPTIEEEARSAGAVFFPWVSAPHRTTRSKEGDLLGDFRALTPLGAFARARDRHAFVPAHLFARELVEHFARRPADVVASDALLFGALAGAESCAARGAKWAAMIPMTSFLPARDRPPPGLGLRPSRGALGHALDRATWRALEAIGDAILWRPCVPHLNRARRAVGLADVAHPLDQIRRADRVLVQTCAWFDFDAPKIAGNVRYVGAELDDPSWAAREIDAGLPRGDDPLVLVAFSTTFMDQARSIERVISALAPLRVRAIVTVGPSLDPRAFRASDDVRVVASASHAAILARAALVVTHGGHGTVIRALAHGVPVVCAPMGRDQSDNAARVEHARAGVTISRRASITAIRAAVERALGDDRLREGAQRAREAILADRASDLAVTELEALAALGAR